MSRKIDLTQPGMPIEDRQYLLDRGRTADLRKYDRRFREGAQAGVVKDPPPGTNSMSDDVKTVEHKEWEEYVGLMTADELREHLELREMDTKGNKAALQKRLMDAGPPVADEEPNQ